MLVIHGQVPSLKNQKQLFINRRTGNRFITSSRASKAWFTDALWQLKGVSPITEYPVQVTLMFYFKGNHKKDLDNAAGGVLDALVKSGVLRDDSWQYVSPLILSCAGIDKENPRVEVSIVLRDL